MRSSGSSAIALSAFGPALGIVILSCSLAYVSRQRDEANRKLRRCECARPAPKTTTNAEAPDGPARD